MAKRRRHRGAGSPCACAGRWRSPTGRRSLVLVAFTLLSVVLGLLYPDFVPSTVLLLPMFVGSLWLGPRMLPWFIVFVCACFCVLLIDQPTVSYRTIGRAIVTFAIALLIMFTSFRRSRLGVSDAPRASRCSSTCATGSPSRATCPSCPTQWLVESVAKSAGGTSFAGDFIVAQALGRRRASTWSSSTSPARASRPAPGRCSSPAPSTASSRRSPASEFLPAANDYLLGQDWDEGFATAIHLHLDLATGDFELRKAGHPPAVWLHAGSGRWSVLNSDGPVLGLLEDADFEVVRGHLGHGDGLLLFTDGLVETAQRDISLGMDKLAGLGERLFQRGFDGGAQMLIDPMEQTNDDRALVIVHRRWSTTGGAERSRRRRPVHGRRSRCGTMVSALASTAGACADVAQW